MLYSVAVCGVLACGGYMNTHPIKRPDGSLHSFEITSAWVTFRPLYHILRSTPGVTDVKRKWFNDNRVAFNFHGKPFVVNEPWGDNSRYWVGLENRGICELDITPLLHAFQNYHSPIDKVWSWVIRRDNG